MVDNRPTPAELHDEICAVIWGKVDKFTGVYVMDTLYVLLQIMVHLMGGLSVEKAERIADEMNDNLKKAIRNQAKRKMDEQNAIE